MRRVLASAALAAACIAWPGVAQAGPPVGSFLPAIDLEVLDVPVPPVSLTYLPEVMVWLRPGADPADLAADWGMPLVRTVHGRSDLAVFSRPNPELQRTITLGAESAAPPHSPHAPAPAPDQAPGLSAQALAQATRAAVDRDLAPLRADPRVVAAFRDTLSPRQLMFTPNDPLFFPGGAFTGAPGQWFLNNTITPGRDVRINGAWAQGFTGDGVVVGVVDDSVDIAHPDLAPNVRPGASWDFASNDPDPTGVTSEQRHGTPVAGLVAARGGNSLGTTGAAPLADLAGLRINLASSSSIVAATEHLSIGPNPVIHIKNHSYGYVLPFFEFSGTDAEETAIENSTAAGTIHFFAAGNSRGTSNQDSNKTDVQNNPNVITVAALASSGIFADYSSFGANVFITVPSSSRRSGEFSVASTDRVGELGYNASGTADGDPTIDTDYTSVFGGTSAASPIAAGVAALVRQAQPNLNTRMLKHLLARTSDVVDPNDATGASDGGWRTNAAGFRFNPNYGFGLIDAAQLVQVAPRFPGITPLRTFSTGELTTDLPATIPDGDPVTGITRSITIAETIPLEEVLVTVSISHTRRGNLEGYLTSPAGTRFRVWIRSSADVDDHINWTFTVNGFWGENPFGIWSLNIRDFNAGAVGTWNSWGLELRMGSLLTAVIPEPAALSLLVPLGLLLRRRRR